MRRKALKELLDEGWMQIGTYGGDHIYAKNDDRILYDTRNETIDLEYKHKEPEIQ
jgi:hypothetical protein